MRIDQHKCVACGNCVPICPMGAISIDTARNRAFVNPDECVECYTCYRGMSMEKLNPTLVRGIRRILKAFRLRDRKSTRLNSSHLGISYAVFCLKKKKQ